MAPTSLDRRRELGAFLRARRERLTPADVGLPGGGRRRTPGLRREEVAQVAGVGVTWYTWLEQARDINVSAPVLDAICRALHLDARERSHAFTLASAVDTSDDQSQCMGLAEGFDVVLHQLDPFPAVTMTWRYDILGYNTAYRFLIDDLDAVPPEERNLLWLFFTRETWHHFSDDPPAVGAHLIAKFRAGLAHHLDDPLGAELVGRLRCESEEFSRLWEQHDVREIEWPFKKFNSPIGPLRFNPHRLSHREGQGGGWTTIYTPHDEATAARLPLLVALAADVAS
ncbi:helix-turn-helix transcriptional regulator [Knoellia sp. CPCC 206453]|uniref:helix-turn-helix transcriptional regulator n=1 Tax=Knoellia pratensis TaxID=3404796 RepID=UPI0036200FE2